MMPKHYCWLDWVTMNGVLSVRKVLVVKGRVLC